MVVLLGRAALVMNDGTSKYHRLELTGRTCAELHPELLEQLLAPKKSETEILVVRPAPASFTAPTARA